MRVADVEEGTPLFWVKNRKSQNEEKLAGQAKQPPPLPSLPAKFKVCILVD